MRIKTVTRYICTGCYTEHDTKTEARHCCDDEYHERRHARLEREREATLKKVRVTFKTDTFTDWFTDKLVTKRTAHAKCPRCGATREVRFNNALGRDKARNLVMAHMARHVASRSCF